MSDTIPPKCVHCKKAVDYHSIDNNRCPVASGLWHPTCCFTPAPQPEPAPVHVQETATPETDAFMNLIDDSEIDLGMVAAKMGDFETQLTALANELAAVNKERDGINLAYEAVYKTLCDRFRLKCLTVQAPGWAADKYDTARAEAAALREEKNQWALQANRLATAPEKSEPSGDAAVKHCQVCNWTNTGLLNVGTPQEGLIEASAFWICHGCIKREHDALATAQATIAKLRREILSEATDMDNDTKKALRERDTARAQLAEVTRQLADAVHVKDQGIQLNRENYEAANRYMAECDSLRATVDTQAAQIVAKDALLNAPELRSFRDGVVLEAAHQRQRWPAEDDAGKKPADWFWLVGYLAGKALHSHIAGNYEKALHHTISTAAALANWHAAILGKTNMRPGLPDSDITRAETALNPEGGKRE